MWLIALNFDKEILLTIQNDDYSSIFFIIEIYVVGFPAERKQHLQNAPGRSFLHSVALVCFNICCLFLHAFVQINALDGKKISPKESIQLVTTRTFSPAIFPTEIQFCEREKKSFLIHKNLNMNNYMKIK